MYMYMLYVYIYSYMYVTRVRLLYMYYTDSIQDKRGWDFSFLPSALVDQEEPAAQGHDHGVTE